MFELGLCWLRLDLTRHTIAILTRRTQTRPRGFQKGGSAVHSQMGICCYWLKMLQILGFVRTPRTFVRTGMLLIDSCNYNVVFNTC